MSEFYIHQKKQKDIWYKEPWMLLVVGGPLIVVIAALATFYLAWHGEDNVLTQDYYKQGVNINNALDQDAKAVEYNMQGNIQVDPASGKVTLSLEGKTTLPDSVLLTLTSHSRNSEYEARQKITLSQINPGTYAGFIKIPANSDPLSLNLWHVKIEASDWRLTAAWHDPLHSQLQLKTQK